MLHGVDQLSVKGMPLARFAITEKTTNRQMHIINGKCLFVHRQHAGRSMAAEGEVPPAVVGDVMRFRQVLLNLLSNAVKFTVSGTVAVRVSCDFAEEATASSEGGVKLRVRVKDTGIGMEGAAAAAAGASAGTSNEVATTVTAISSPYDSSTEVPN